MIPPATSRGQSGESFAVNPLVPLRNVEGWTDYPRRQVRPSKIGEVPFITSVSTPVISTPAEFLKFLGLVLPHVPN